MSESVENPEQAEVANPSSLAEEPAAPNPDAELQVDVSLVSCRVVLSLTFLL